MLLLLLLFYLVAVAGSAIKWLRDQMKIIKRTSEINDIAASVEDTGGVYFVTAFSGLLAPYWDPSAGGLLIGASAGPFASLRCLKKKGEEYFYCIADA